MGARRKENSAGIMAQLPCRGPRPSARDLAANSASGRRLHRSTAHCLLKVRQQRHQFARHQRELGVELLFRALRGNVLARFLDIRSEEHTSEVQSLMRISYAVFCLKTKKIQHIQ